MPDNVLVAEVDGDVAGWVKVQSPTPLLSHAHVLEIGGLAVDPTRQGAGVGRRLVEAAVQECSRRGARKVTLRVLSPNTAARRLYESCGFITEGVLHEAFMLQGRYVDDVLMPRQLVVPVPKNGSSVTQDRRRAALRCSVPVDRPLPARPGRCRTGGGLWAPEDAVYDAAQLPLVRTIRWTPQLAAVGVAA